MLILQYLETSTIHILSLSLSLGLVHVCFYVLEVVLEVVFAFALKPLRSQHFKLAVELHLYLPPSCLQVQKKKRLSLPCTLSVQKGSFTFLRKTPRALRISLLE